MHSIDFEYSTYAGKKVPLIPLNIKSKDKWYEIWAFVDSGATYSVFKAKEAERLDIDIYSGKEIMVIVGDGSFIPVYFRNVTLMIGELEFLAEVGFSERLGVGFNLLGRKDIFEIFKVCFSDKKGIISFFKEVQDA